MKFLKAYPTQKDIISQFKTSEVTFRWKVWALLGNIQALKAVKVRTQFFQFDFLYYIYALTNKL